MPARVRSDAAVIDVLRGLRTAGLDGGPAPEVLYGRRKMTEWLPRNGFPDIGKRTVDRLMREQRMRGVVRGAQTRTTIGAKTGTQAQLPHQRPEPGLGDGLHLMATWTGFVYVAFAIDLFSRAVVGWSIATVKDVTFVEACLKMALWRRDHLSRPIPVGMVHHCDYAEVRVRPRVRVLACVGGGS